jgi:hypothetical protein
MLLNWPGLTGHLTQLGPLDPMAGGHFQKMDRTIGELASAAKQAGMATIVVSGNPMFPVAAPIAINMAFRQKGWMSDSADPRSAQVFAVADHQVAHVYCKQSLAPEVARLAKSIDRGMKVLAHPDDKALYHVDHPRAGNVVLIAPVNKYFVYRWWEGEAPASHACLGAHSDAGAVRGSQGHLPSKIDDYGVLVAGIPLPRIQRRPFVGLGEIAGILSELLTR